MVQDCDGFVRPWRLDVLRFYDLLHPQLVSSAAICSGVSLTFESDCEELALDYTNASLFHGCAFDLIVDGVATPAKSIPAVAPLPPGLSGEDKAALMRRHPRASSPPNAVARWSGLGSERKRLEIWLPHAVAMRYHALRVPPTATVSRVADDRPVWCVYGSSLTQCAEAETPLATWPARVARRADLRLRNLGFSGACQGGKRVSDSHRSRELRDLKS